MLFLRFKLTLFAYQLWAPLSAPDVSIAMNASRSISMGIPTQVPNSTAVSADTLAPLNYSAVSAHKLMELPARTTTVRWWSLCWTMCLVVGCARILILLWAYTSLLEHNIYDHVCWILRQLYLIILLTRTKNGNKILKANV